jgi:hypothetical protein
MALFLLIFRRLLRQEYLFLFFFLIKKISRFEPRLLRKIIITPGYTHFWSQFKYDRNRNYLSYHLSNLLPLRDEKVDLVAKKKNYLFH